VSSSFSLMSAWHLIWFFFVQSVDLHLGTIASWNLLWNLLHSFHVGIITEHIFQCVTPTWCFDTRSNMTGNKRHGTETLRSHQLCSYSRTSKHFMEPEGSLLCLQEPSACPYLEPDWSSPYHFIQYHHLLLWTIGHQVYLNAISYLECLIQY
jgi:hypothetical protein